MTEPLSLVNPAIPLLCAPVLPAFPLDSEKGKPDSTPDSPANVWTQVGVSKEDGLTTSKGVLTISFLNGTDYQKAKVRRYARDWRRGAPTIRYRYTFGIHGRVRIAFDDPQPPLDVWQQFYWDQENVPYERTVGQMVFAYIGRNTLRAFDTPENVHIGSVNANTDKASPAEKMYIHHAFGHVLGLKFAGVLPDDTWQKAVVATVARQLAWLPTPLKGLFQPSIMDSSIKTPSVMQFGWKTDITRNDLVAIAKKYPIQTRVIRSSIRDLAEKSASHVEDLDLYVLGWDNRIYKNRRVYERKTALSPPTVSWKYWTDVLEDSLPNNLAPPAGIPEDVEAIPVKFDPSNSKVSPKGRADAEPDPADFAIIDLADRLEILVIDKKGVFQFKQLNKANNTWTLWTPPTPENPAAKKIKIIEVEGGYEVIFLRKDNKLAHFSRKSGDPELPREYHPIRSENPIHRIVAARVGPPTNPIKIYASSEGDLYSAELDQKTLTWTLTSVQAEKVPGRKEEIAFGMAGTTENAFVVGPDKQLWHNRNADGGWFEWAKLLPGVKVSKFTVGESSSKDSESRYLQVFVLDEEGKLYYNRVHEEGYWNPSNDARLDTDVKDTDPWLAVKAGDEKSYFGGPPLAYDIYNKRAKSGDLQVFLVARDADYQNQIYCLNIDIDGFRDEEGNREVFVPRVWGKWKKDEDY